LNRRVREKGGKTRGSVGRFHKGKLIIKVLWLGADHVGKKKISGEKKE